MAIDVPGPSVVAPASGGHDRHRHNGYRFSLPVLAPTGSMDPFYISIEKHYRASDHIVYMSYDIPSVIFVTWPDMYCHSSADTPDKLDATQFKRAGGVGTAAMGILASADDEMAAPESRSGRKFPRSHPPLRCRIGALA